MSWRTATRLRSFHPSRAVEAGASRHQLRFDKPKKYPRRRFALISPSKVRSTSLTERNHPSVPFEPGEHVTEITVIHNVECFCKTQHTEHPSMRIKDGMFVILIDRQPPPVPCHQYSALCATDFVIRQRPNPVFCLFVRLRFPKHLLAQLILFRHFLTGETPERNHRRGFVLPLSHRNTRQSATVQSCVFCQRE